MRKSRFLNQSLGLGTNRDVSGEKEENQFQSSCLPPLQSESKCDVFMMVISFISIERFSIECRKTKTKVITLANQEGRRQSRKPFKTPSNYT